MPLPVVKRASPVTPPIGIPGAPGVTGSPAIDAALDEGTEDLLASLLDPIMRSTAPGKNRFLAVILWIIRAPLALAGSLPPGVRTFIAAPTAVFLEGLFFGKAFASDPVTRTVARSALRNGFLAVMRKAADITDDREREKFLHGEIERIPADQTPPAAGNAPAGNGKVAVSALVDGNAHLTDVGNASLVLCRKFFDAKQAWEKTQLSRGQPQQNDQQQGGRGKGRGGQQPQTGGKFPQDLYTLEQAKQIGLDECPVCKPFTAAGMAAQEAAMATASTAAAPAADTTKPIEGWDEKVGKVGRWLARALDASVESADQVDDKKYVDPLAWKEMAITIAFETLQSHTDAKMRGGFTNEGGLNPLTAEQVMALPPKLSDDQTERTVRFIFGQGAGKLRKATQLQALIGSFTGKKKKAEETKRLKDAQAKVAAAPDAAAKIDAERELAEVRDELVPKKSPWPRRIIIGGAVTFVLMVIVVMVAVSQAMSY